MPTPVEIEPPGVRVDLDRHVMFCASLQHHLDIDGVARAAQQLAPGRMTQDGSEGIGNRPHDPRCLRCFIKMKSAVDTGDNEIERLQHLIGIVQRAILADVGFDTLQDAEATPISRIQPIDLSKVTAGGFMPPA